MWQMYIADTTQTCSENTAKFVSGKYIQKRYYDTIKLQSHNDNRTGDEIVNDVLCKIGLEVK